MLTVSDNEQVSPFYSNDEIPTSEDDLQNYLDRSHIKKIILHYKKKVPFVPFECEEPFELMNLPREIRDIIYGMILTEPNGTLYIMADVSTNLHSSQAAIGHVRDSRYFPFLQSWKQPAGPRRNIALLRTSKTIHAEAGAILYRQKLVFRNLVAMQSFLIRLRPSQISLMRDVSCAPDDIDTYFISCNGFSGHPNRVFMPSVMSLLAGADNLENLDPDITDIDHMLFELDHGMLNRDGISVAGWDAVVARGMATEVYRYLFTYLRRAVAVRGIDKVLDVLDVFSPIFQHGPDGDRFLSLSQPRNVTGVKWTEERKVAMKKAMGKEIERLLKQDNF